jgi:hypothetical protein
LSWESEVAVFRVHMLRYKLSALIFFATLVLLVAG